MIGAFSGLLFPIVLIAIVVFVVRKMKSGEQNPIRGHSVRRFFQYLLLYGLIVVSAVGLSGLLGRALGQSTLIAGDQTDLARNLSFTVVGIPLYLALAMWTRRKFVEEPSETKSFGWGFYLTMTCLTSLSVGMFALHDMVSWAVRANDYRGPALARLIVWGVVWGTHWWVHLRLTPAGNTRAHHLLGSVIGLGTVVVGLDQLISTSIQRLWNFGGDVTLLSHGDSVLKSAVTLIVGVPVWFLYWIKNYSKTIRDPVWLAYVLLVGVGSGLVMAIVSASTVLYSALVWFVGDPGSAGATTHFRDMPAAFGAFCVGMIVWWYHHAVLEEDRKTTRTEVQRIYEYLMSGIGLLAAAGGLAMILVALVESLTSTSVIAGSGAKNTLLAAVTLLIVGSPVWWIFWHGIQSAISKFSIKEQASPARRVYLFILFGLGGIVAVITLLVGVFFLFDDIFKGNFGLETFRRIRFALSILVTTGAIAGYHWLIYRSEKDSSGLGNQGPRFVLLVGPKDAELLHAVSDYTGGRVQTWRRNDDQEAAWSQVEVMKILEESKDEAIILIADSKGLRTIPIDRS